MLNLIDFMEVKNWLNILEKIFIKNVMKNLSMVVFVKFYLGIYL